MGIAVTNLIAMDVRVYFKCVPFKTEKGKLCSVYVIFKESFGKKISDLPRKTTDAVYK